MSRRDVRKHLRKMTF